MKKGNKEGEIDGLPNSSPRKNADCGVGERLNVSWWARTAGKESGLGDQRSGHRDP